ncbi:hypothetical protein [Aestuariivivens sediminis]|uniref:hypothetical protein n=1 Tax=Aestuariivivens sediminis TaxID=2913557 RepID=UPI001F598F2B|nr:hypothetical protein [Aestuariivivens sediminis]
MILKDNQSLLLCGILVAGIFVSGIFDILDNFMVLTLLILIYGCIVANIIYTKSKSITSTVDNHTQEKTPSEHREF